MSILSPSYMLVQVAGRGGGHMIKIKWHALRMFARGNNRGRNAPQISTNGHISDRTAARI